MRKSALLVVIAAFVGVSSASAQPHGPGPAPNCTIPLPPQNVIIDVFVKDPPCAPECKEESKFSFAKCFNKCKKEKKPAPAPQPYLATIYAPSNLNFNAPASYCDHSNAMNMIHAAELAETAAEARKAAENEELRRVRAAAQRLAGSYTDRAPAAQTAADLDQKLQRIVDRLTRIETILIGHEERLNKLDLPKPAAPPATAPGAGAPPPKQP